MKLSQLKEFIALGREHNLERLELRDLGLVINFRPSNILESQDKMPMPTGEIPDEDDLLHWSSGLPLPSEVRKTDKQVIGG